MMPPIVASETMNSREVPVVHLEAISVEDSWKGEALHDLELSLSPGRVFHLVSDSASSAHLLMRCLATLDWPSQGRYLFQGEVLTFTRYERLLSTKRRIGYLYPMAAMVRNRTVEENLDYQAHYFDDIDREEHRARKEALVADFSIGETLPLSPERVGAMAQRRAIMVRELLKGPSLFLAEYPEEFLEHGHLSAFMDEIRKILFKGGIFVYITNFKGFGKELTPVILRLEKGRLCKEQEP